LSSVKKSVGGSYARVCNGLCEIVPRARREKKVYPMLSYAGVRDDFDVFLGKRIFLGVLIGVIGAQLPWASRMVNFGYSFEQVFAFSLLLFFVFAGISGLLFYLHIFYVIEARKKLAEKVLPDFLLLVSSNIRAGMTPFAAFRHSARDEFGPLAEEIKIATSKSLGTGSFTEALSKVSERIASDSLSETVSFFAQAIKSGGKVAMLLETTASDMQQTQALKKEMVSSTKMYVMFVVFVVVIATPILLSVSVQFLDMIESIQSEADIGSGSGTSFLSTKLNISSDFLMTVALVLLSGNAFLASMFIGVIGQGKLKLGLKYFPVILIISVLVFLISRVIFGGFLGN